MSNVEKNEFFKEKIISIKKITEDILQIKISKPKGFDYISGQFVQIKIPDKNKNDFVLRPYSFSSTNADDYLEFCIKLLENGLASNYLKNLKETDFLSFTKNDGNFIYKNPENLEVYFIATGVGLSPIFSIIKDELINKNNKTKFNLIFGTRTKKDIFWEKEINELKNKHKNFNFKIFLSKEKYPACRQAGKYNSGHVTDFLKNIKSNNYKFFICGNPEMIRDSAQILLTKKVDINNIHFEIFE